ncbi:MAG: flagellar hook protein FlgE [Roseburia sp.]
MMRSLYSAVSGLKTHQTKMDVIGNNIANVNTVAFKSSSVTFSDVMYQTTSNASGANAATGTGGVNAKQIGLGVTAAATRVSVTSAGAAETTGDPFDIKLTDANSTNFFIVNNGTENVFTRDGSFYVDGAGNLCMSGTGYTVMGWQVDPITGDIKKDTVSALRIMQEKNLTSDAEATENATVTGVFDSNDSNLSSKDGLVKNLTFYDDLGYAYTARFTYRLVDADNGEYTVELSDVLDSDGKSIVYDENGNFLNGITSMSQLFGDENSTTFALSGYTYDAANGGYVDADSAYIYRNDGAGNFTRYEYDATNSSYDPASATAVDLTYNDFFGIPDYATGVALDPADPTSATAILTNYTVKFSPADGSFTSVGGATTGRVTFKASALNTNGNFHDITVDFSQCKDSNNNGSSTIGMDKGDVDGTTGAGKKLGTMTGITIDTSGKIYGTYDNGNTELLGQIAVAQFANAAGLEKLGNNCYTTTLNSGEFDGIGVEISADGSAMSTGQLEMSNVDLSTEFTQMIITQRGFQANSRIITVSDTLLEELINLKR